MTALDVYIEEHQEEYSVDNVIIYGKDISAYFDALSQRHQDVVHIQGGTANICKTLQLLYGGSSLYTLLKVLEPQYTNKHIVLLVSDIDRVFDPDDMYTICYLMSMNSRILVVLGYEGNGDEMYDVVRKFKLYGESGGQSGIDIRRHCLLRYNLP